MSILLHEDVALFRQQVEYARQLLVWFVDGCNGVFGNFFCVYNVHNLIHLADDVVKNSCSLNEISAFKYENFVQYFKKIVRSTNNPVAQIVKRTRNGGKYYFQC